MTLAIGYKTSRPRFIITRWILAFPRSSALLSITLSLWFLSCSSNSELAEYLSAADEIDDAWQESVTAAYVGREYLATGDDPPRRISDRQLLAEAEDAFGQLADATALARSGMKDLAPPEEAEDFHKDWFAVLTDLESLWSEAETALAVGDYERFLIVYDSTRGDLVRLETRMEDLRIERIRLGEKAR